MATTLKQEFELIEQDQDNAIAAFKALCKARYAMHVINMQWNAAFDREQQIANAEYAPDNYHRVCMYGVSYRLHRAIQETLEAARAVNPAEIMYMDVLKAWLDAA